MVKLDTIVAALERSSQNFEQYLNLETGQIEEVFEEADLLEGEALASDSISAEQYVRLPNQRELDEYKIMTDFAYLLENEKLKAKLLTALNKRCCFRGFKEELSHWDSDSLYFAFRKKAYYDIARDWCDQNEILYE